MSLPAEVIDVCYFSPIYFVNNFVKIFSTVTNDWVDFNLYPYQAKMIKTIHDNRFVVVPKGRRAGGTSAALGYSLYLARFRPGSQILFVSKREDDAKELLGEFRFLGMYERLHKEFKEGFTLTTKSKKHLVFSNGSSVRALPSKATAGGGYNFVLFDEVDLIHSKDQQRALLGVKPTAQLGNGKIVLVSTAVKENIGSPFKKIIRASIDGKNDWKTVFIPANEIPGLSGELSFDEWYQKEKLEAELRGDPDYMSANYPLNIEEFLAPPVADKRFPYRMLRNVYSPKPPLVNDSVFVKDTKVFDNPMPGIKYVIGIDVAEGNINSDYSVACVMEKNTGVQVAVMRAKIEIKELCDRVEMLSLAYNNAPVLPERNAIGTALIECLKDKPTVTIIRGEDGKYGFFTSNKSKKLLLARLSQQMFDLEVTIRDQNTFEELSAIRGSTLSAPPGMHDDLAMAFALATYARSRQSKRRKKVVRTVNIR